MGMIEFNSDEVKDLVLLPDGEHLLRIAEADIHLNEKKNSTSIKLSLKAQEEPNAQTIYNYVGVPSPNDDEEKIETKKRMMKAFCDAFQVDLSGGGIDTDTLAGLTGWAILGTESDANYGDRNVVKRFVVQ